uniref:Uncharacterized protein n=1 Tax=Oryza glumipatula TaxID=40148 RepID=A0A0E0AA17_9ORYZ
MWVAKVLTVSSKVVNDGQKAKRTVMVELRLSLLAQTEAHKVLVATGYLENNNKLKTNWGGNRNTKPEFSRMSGGGSMSEMPGAQDQYLNSWLMEICAYIDVGAGEESGEGNLGK